MKTSIRIGSRTVGQGHPLFVAAECGVTCMYDLKIAKELVDVVKDAGADAIKFIFWFPDEIMADRSVTWTYKTVDGVKTENMYEMLQKYRFSLDEWREIKAYCDAKGVLMFATVNSPTGIAWAEELDLPAYKMSSWDYNHLPLYREIAAKGKPLIMDTGPVWPVDLWKVLDAMREVGNDQALLVHDYHTDDPAQWNMRSIPYMREAFGVPVGYSSPDTADEMDIAAVALGASFLEKRLTLSRSLPGHHHVQSKEPAEFRAWVAMIRKVHAAMGEHALVPSTRDLAERRKWFRHIVADVDIPAGTKLTAAMLAGKRGDGVSPEHLDRFLGRAAKRALKANEPLSWDDI